MRRNAEGQPNVSPPPDSPDRRAGQARGPDQTSGQRAHKSPAGSGGTNCPGPLRFRLLFGDRRGRGGGQDRGGPGPCASTGLTWVTEGTGPEDRVAVSRIALPHPRPDAVVCLPTLE